MAKVGGLRSRGASRNPLAPNVAASLRIEARHHTHARRALSAARSPPTPPDEAKPLAAHTLPKGFIADSRDIDAAAPPTAHALPAIKLSVGQ